MTSLWQKPWAPNASTTSLNNINGYYAWETPFAFLHGRYNTYIYIYIYLGIMFSFREGKSKKFSRSNRNTHMFSSSHHGSDFLGIGKGQARESTMSATNEDISAWRLARQLRVDHDDADTGGMPWNKNWRKKNKHTILFLKALSWPIKISKIKTEDFKPSTGCLPKKVGFPPKSSICS